MSTNVFFAENNGTPSAVSASDLDFTGAAPWARFSVTVTLPDGWQNAWVDVAFDYTTGRLEFRLTPEGIAEMQRLGVTGKPLVDFIQITVLDRGTGNTFDYNVELIATKDQEFDSAAHDSQYGGNVALDNIGEFHQGQNGGGAYSIISSTKNDEIILNDTLVGGSSIHASGSADPALMADDYNTINLNAGVSNTTADSITRVTSTDGILKVQGGVSAQGDNAENFISMGKGQVHINNASGHGINAVAGENTILGRELLVNASDKGIYAEDGGSNTVETKGGDVSINAEGSGMVAENNSSNAVSATGGSVNITSSGAEGIAAYENSANTLSVSGGNVNIKSAWAGVGASDYSANTISVTNGSINIVTDTWGITTNNNSTANIDVTNGSLGIDALGRGIHSYGESTNNVHVTNGDVNVNSGWGWDGIIAHFGGTNNVAVDNGSVVINSGGAGMTAFYDSKNELSVNDGSLHINAEWTGVSANSGGVNTIAVTGGDVSITSTSSYDAAVVAYGGKNTISANGNVEISAGGSGIFAKSDGANSIEAENGNVTVSGSGALGYGMNAASSGSNSITTEAGDVRVFGSGASGASYAMAAYDGGNNSIRTTNGDVNVYGYSASACGVGMFAQNAGSNSVASQSGDVTVAGSGAGDESSYGIFAGGMDSSNSIVTQSGSVVAYGNAADSGSAYGMAAFASGNNRISTDSGSVVVYGIAESGESYGMVAKNAGTNSIETDSGAVMVESGSPTTSTGMWADSAGSANRITTDSGDIFLFADGLGSEDSKGMLATDSGINSIGTQSGATVIAGGMHATTSGSNSVTARSGDVTIVGSGTGDNDGFGMLARGAGSSNTVATQSGSVVASVSGTDSSYAFGMAAMSSGKNRISTETGAVAVSGTGSAGTGDGYGMFANNAGGNIIETASGDVAVSSDSASRSYGMWAFSSGSKNSITTDSGSVSVDASSSANGISNGMFAENSGSNGIVSQSGSVNVIATSVGGNSYGMNAQNSGNNHIAAGDSPVVVSATSTGGAGHGMYAYSFGNSFNSNNSITTEGGAVTISGAGESGYGMHAYSYDSSSSSSNSIASAAGIPLTVTITATADSAQKAIAMWADGGRAVNYITGHSQSGGVGDNITLNGGIAMQTANGGRNIITTGAGNDHVTINGAVKGSGNQINVGGGSNTVTLNGAVETGSLNVIATGGTYTLILQATSTESFAERYGQWLNNIASDGLIAGGLTSINFDGLDVANLPADFLTTFNDLLHDLHSSGISIEPAGLFDHLHDPAAAAAPMMFVGGDIAEHSNTDSIHAGASDDGQAAHAAGLGTVQGHDTPNTADIHTLDEAASVAVIGSGGTESSNPDDSTGAQDTSAQGDSTAADTHPAQGHDVTGGVEPAADDVPHDALQSQDALLGTGAHPQLDTHMAENTDSVMSSTESGHEDSPVLDDLLSEHSFYGSENVGLLFNGESLNQLDGGPASDVTSNHSGEVHADIVLSQGDVSLDSLFGEVSMSSDEYGSMHQDGDSATNMAGMSLTDMHTAMTVDAPAESANVTHGDYGTGSSMIDGGAAAPAWDNVQPSVENSLQETANTAMRQIEAC
ncbi:hypothetical protein [uncultured Desulfovibrio sp.]|uniref:beta strand repeat-containing protein n=1 Tax=uncultured Desulfovibrio sp. TaxID=167968 RepID=UPI002623AA7A|nr:hypothetical protein [uncultured Desulfovibrio sp.]